MLGIMAALIPFPDHSQSPRNCYQSSMGKQALGIPLLSYNLRTDTILHVLQYPQRPIVCTKMADILGINNMPSGINAIVAIACYSGYNQEDSVMLNLSSIQRGLFCLTSYHSIDCCEKKRDTYSFEEICLPPPNSDPSIKEGQPNYFRRRNANYSLLDKNGVVRPREKFVDGKWVGAATVVKKNDVIIGKVIVSGNKSTEESRTDASIIIQPGEEGTIDQVHTMITPNGYKLVKIVIRITREPTLGDKLASRAAQKGTIGMVYRQEDMPFTSQGITPDIIINPLCMPSRMTINQLVETALGKECVIKGIYGDATPFTEQSVNVADKLVKRLEQNLQGHGFQSQGWERMYNGMTGEMIKTRIFIGPTYYQRLKHMVDDKMHARAQGNVTMLTRQPLEGRSRDGGLRFGEMERDCMIAHGNSAILKERLFLVSDPFQISVCKKCGVMTSNLKECQVCKGDGIISCNFPYASKLLHQELTSLGLKVTIRPDEK
jgi:DNA-directed RNA polymerase II subunit RPB2